MIFDVGLLNLIMYCAQQLGIALGLGAQTIMLVAYVNAMRDGAIDDYEAQFLRATRSVLWISLVLIVVSGLSITVLHFATGQTDTVMSPAYLFKFALIAAVVVLTGLLHVLPETFAEGLLGGTWYALFLVHILAPVTSWTNLLTLLVVWLVGFNLIWYVVAFSTRERVRPPQVGKKSFDAISTYKAPQPKLRKPFFSFLHKKEAAVTQEPQKPAEVAPLAPVVRTPAQFQQIILDPVPRTQPVAVPEVLKPVEVKVPIAPSAPLPQIKTDAAPVVMRQALPIEKLPANQMTDTPFLPQVPPLQPIPVILPGTSAPTAATTAASVPAAGIPKTNGQPPVLQKPEDLPQSAPTIPPEIKLGLNVMPKSPEQLKQ